MSNKKEIKYQKFRCMKPKCNAIIAEYNDKQLKGKFHQRIKCSHCGTWNYLNIDKEE